MARRKRQALHMLVSRFTASSDACLWADISMPRQELIGYQLVRVNKSAVRREAQHTNLAYRCYLHPRIFQETHHVYPRTPIEGGSPIYRIV